MYSFYHEDEDGFIRQDEISAENAVIIESAEADPTITGTCDIGNTSLWTISVVDEPFNCEFTMTIPPGSIVRDFNLDLEG